MLCTEEHLKEISVSAKIYTFKQRTIEISDFVTYFDEKYPSQKHEALVVGKIEHSQNLIVCRLDTKEVAHVPKNTCSFLQPSRVAGNLIGLVCFTERNGKQWVVHAERLCGMPHVTLQNLRGQRFPRIPIDQLRFFAVVR